jgi:hypothetical protein
VIVVFSGSESRIGEYAKVVRTPAQNETWEKEYEREVQHPERDGRQQE